MKSSIKLISIIAVSLILAGCSSKPSVDISIYSDFSVDTESGKITQYNWAAVGISKDGKYSCVETFSEEKDPSAISNARKFAADLDKKIKANNP